MKKNYSVIFIILIFFLASCRKDRGPYIVEPAPGATVAQLCFAKEIQPIFDANCITCHDENHPFLNLKAPQSWYELYVTGTHAPYIDTLHPTQSLLYLRITTDSIGAGRMPLGGTPLTLSTTNKILKWIEQGAKNN